MYVYLLAALLLPTTFGKVAKTESEVVNDLPELRSMLQHAAEEKKFTESRKEDDKEEEEEASRMNHEVGSLKGGTCGQTCSSMASESVVSCATPAATEAAVQLNDAIQTVAVQTRESDSNGPMAEVKAKDHQTDPFSDEISWPLLLAGVGLLLLGQYGGWDGLLHRTGFQNRLPECSVRKVLTTVGLLAFAEGSDLLDARAFAFSFICVFAATSICKHCRFHSPAFVALL